MRLPDRDRRHDLVHAGAHHELGFARARFAAARQPERVGDRDRQRSDAVAAAPARRDPVRGARGGTGRERGDEEARGAASLVEPVGGEEQGSGAACRGSRPSRSMRPSEPTWRRSGRTRRLTASSGRAWNRSQSATPATSARAATPSTSISSAPSRKLPTTSPSAAPVSDQPRRVSVVMRFVLGPIGGPGGALTRAAPSPRRRAGHRHRGQDRPHDVARRHAAQLGVGREHQPVLEHRGQRRASRRRGSRSRGRSSRRARAPRAAATSEPRGLAPSTRSGWRRVAATRSSDVVAHLGGDVHGAHERGGVGDVVGAGDGCERRRRSAARSPWASRIASSASRAG